MNKTITNLSLIADAAEYQDRNTSAAWRIRSTLQSIAVWTANAFLTALKTDNSERIFNAAVKLSTVRVWMRDCNSSSFVLDLTPTGVANTLGVDREIDIHVEAERIARQKCKAVLSAKRFKEYYTRAKESLLEQQAQRKERVESITDLLSDQSMSLTQDVRDYASTFHGLTLSQTVADEDLYDDNSVERESDRLNETVGVACEAMLNDIDVQLGATIIAAKMDRFLGYRKAVLTMMEVVGVDTKKLVERQQKLAASIDEAAASIGAQVATVEADIAAQMDEIRIERQCEEPAPAKTKTKRVIRKIEAAHA